MVNRLLRRDLDRLLANYVHRLDSSNMPSNAQLSRLRAVALNALPKGDVQRLIEFLSEDKLKARAREQYLAARIDGVQLLDWLQTRLQQPGKIWDLLSPGGITPPQISTVQAQLAGLADEYTIRLVESVLHRAARRERENE
jgi:hypothetical protein